MGRLPASRKVENLVHPDYIGLEEGAIFPAESDVDSRWIILPLGVGGWGLCRSKGQERRS
jgi:hypothetical protein